MLGHVRGILTQGRFGKASRTGMALSDGYFWTQRAGGYAFYVGSHGAGSIDFENPIAMCGPDASTLTISQLLDAETRYDLAVRTISVFGVESAPATPLRVRTNVARIPLAVPMPVGALSWHLAAGGTVGLSWTYEPAIGHVEPARFDIFVGRSDETLDYSSVYAQAAFRAGCRVYRYDSTDLGGDRQWKLTVRAVTSAGVDDGSTACVIAQADTQGPGAIETYELEQLGT